jgi:ribosomal protein L5
MKSESARLKKVYDKEIVPLMMKKFSYTNINMVPKLAKITVNCQQRNDTKWKGC